MSFLVKDDNATKALRAGCIAPFFNSKSFPDGGFMDGRFCKQIAKDMECCLPCPMTDWVYPDNFNTMTQIASWACVVGTICCAFLLLSWIVLPVEKTHRHYLSISMTCAVVIMNLGFVVPLAAKPEQCFNEITPHGMQTSKVCAASGTFLLFGGFAGTMWVFLRALSLHLQICWQVVVGRNYMFFSQATGWLIPTLIVILTMVFSGVSFRFGATCHINHKNSLADFWVPILVVAGLTVLIQFATFGYCIKVYLASLSDNSATTEGSSLPTYSNSIRTMTPRQAYRRIRRVIQLQWRGIAIVLMIIADVIFFSVVFVFQDKASQDVLKKPELSTPWINCLIKATVKGEGKNACLSEAGDLTVSLSTTTAVLLLLALNGVWLLILLGRWSMVMGWYELFGSLMSRNKKEFVSVDARFDVKNNQRSYEMLSRDSSAVVTPLTPVKPTASPSSGRRTPDYFGQTARYQPPVRSFSSPRPPRSPSPPTNWDSSRTHARPNGYGDMNPLGMNKI